MVCWNGWYMVGGYSRGKVELKRKDVKENLPCRYFVMGMSWLENLIFKGKKDAKVVYLPQDTWNFQQSEEELHSLKRIYESEQMTGYIGQFVKRKSVSHFFPFTEVRQEFLHICWMYYESSAFQDMYAGKQFDKRLSSFWRFFDPESSL